MAVPVRNSGLTLSPDNLTPADRTAQTSIPTSTAPVVMQPGQTAVPNTPPVATGVRRPAGAYNPYTKGFETINPGTGVNQGQYSPEAKQALWEQSGNTGQANMDAFYRKEDMSMGIKPEFVKNVNPNALTDAQSMDAYLNGLANSSYLQNGGNAQNTDLASIMNQLNKGGTAPNPFNRAESYSNLRSQYGVGDLESQLADLEKQYADEMAATRQMGANERNKLASTGVMDNRVSEIERQQNERIDSINRQRAAISNQLQAKNSTISAMMQYMGEDAAAATQRYDAEYNKNIQMINLARGIQQDQISHNDKIQDNARASLTTIYNAAMQGGIEPSKMTDSQKAMIGKLELQAGMPPGFIQNVYDKNPKSDIVYSAKSTDADGNDYVNLILKDKVTGDMKTQKMLLGKSAEYAKQQAELRIKQQQADAASVKAAKYNTAKSGGGSGWKAKTSASDKAAVALKGKVDTLLGNLRVKVSTGEMDSNGAHNEAYQKYGKDMMNLGYTDAQVKNYLYNGLK